MKGSLARGHENSSRMVRVGTTTSMDDRGTRGGKDRLAYRVLLRVSDLDLDNVGIRWAPLFSSDRIQIRGLRTGSKRRLWRGFCRSA